MVEVTSVRGSRLSGFGYDDVFVGSEAIQLRTTTTFLNPKKSHIKLTALFKEFEMSGVRRRPRRV
jgi:hypothetical protein